jgi:hypothetical protein
MTKMGQKGLFTRPSKLSQEVLKVWFINHFFAEEVLTFVSPVAIFYDIHYPL